MAVLITARQAYAAEEKQFFSVAEQPVSTALLEVAQQAGASILFPQELFADIKSNHLEGEYDLKEALDILLAGTNIDVFIVEDTKQIIVSFNDMKENNKKQVAGEQTEARGPQGRRSLLATTIAALFAGGAANAIAQEQAPDQSGLEEVVVTGSRIVRRDLEASSPIMTVDAARFEQSSNLSVEAVLNQMTQFAPAQNQFSAQTEIQTSPSTSLGIGSTNLRGVGANRSLVLIDGRRAQPANAALVVDLNTIPSAAIERVETITGGASSVYGADALAGVVNFVLKDNYEGATFDLQSGITEVGDAQETRFSGLLGMNSADGRGNVMLGVEWYEREAAYQKDRDFYVDGWNDLSNNIDTAYPALPGFAASTTDPSLQPSQAAVDSLFPQYPPGTISPASTFYFNKDGSAFVRTINGAPGFDDSQLHLPNTGDGFYGLIRQANGTVAQQYMDGPMSTPLDRRSAYGKAHYDISDHLEAFVQANFSRTTVQTYSNSPPPAVGGNWSAQIPNDGRQAIPPGLQTLLDSRPNASANWQLNRGLDFLGQFGPANSSDVYQITAGLEGSFETLDWTWEAFYTSGETNATNVYETLPSVQRWKLLAASPEFGKNQAILGTSNYQMTCTSGLPIYYGTTAETTQDCLDAMNSNMRSLTGLKQEIAEANLQGHLLDLPAGEVRFAAGISRRKNDFTYRPGNPQATIFDNPLGLFVSNPTEGSTTVSEIYGELLVPVLANVDLELGYRLSDYDTKAGKVGTWKALVDWSPADWVRLRGGFQVANRAPNTAELYLAETVTFERTFASGDPCQVVTTAAGWGNTPDNPNRLQVQELCAALIGSTNTEFGAPGSYEANNFGAGNTSNGGISAVNIGNPDLDAEQAETWTGGVVFQEPLGIEGLSASIDYYSIKITDAIGAFSGYEIYQNCFNANGSSNPTLSMNDPGGFCALIDRADTGGLGNVRATYLNTGIIETSGTDVAANWTSGLPWGGDLYVNASMSFLHEFVTQSTPSSPRIEARDTLAQNGQFKYRLNTTVGYNFADTDASVGLRMRYLPGIRDATASVTPDTPYLPVDSYTNFDLFGSITLLDRYQLRGGIDNLFDADPSIVGATATDSNSNSTMPNYYDALGRRYYLGVKVQF
jgi:outer membrane receptor protein involved in Fe transport